MKRLFIVAITIVCFSCKKEIKPNTEVVEGVILKKESKIEVVSHNYETLEPLLNIKDDKTYVVNFWATWCKPCVEEMPAFEKLYSEYKDKNVEVLLVSLDFPNQIKKRVIPYIEKNNLQPKVVLMADPDQNTWIPKVSKKWSGAIPATLIYNKDTRNFYEQSFDYETLEKEVHKFLKNN